MILSKQILNELQNRLKVGNRRGVHLNAIPSRSRYKFDLNRLSHIDKNLPQDFINHLLTEQPLKFKISWLDNVPDLNTLFEEDQIQLVKITKSFENLINQTEAIESEKGINTFGFGFPLLVRRNQGDNNLTVSPILIWSLRIKRTKEFNTWIVERNEDDPIYINEVLINHLQNDAQISIGKLPAEMLDDGLIGKDELLDICVDMIKSVNSSTSDNIRETFEQKLNQIKSIPDKKHYEGLPLTSNNSMIDFSGLFSIFEVQKQNIIHDYSSLQELEGLSIEGEDLEGHFFQPISSVETDPSQQGILHALENKRNLLIQGPPGTGKSQSLTAVLVNALENHKRTVVVCEKRTALEVLHNALQENGLENHCVLIKDIVKDRRKVVNSVRNRVDEYRGYHDGFMKEPLDNLVEKCKNLISSINRQHKKVNKNILEDKNWTSIIGNLLKDLKTNEDDYELEFDKSRFSYDSKEYNQLIELAGKGQELYKDYKKYAHLSFLNPLKLKGDNQFSLEQEIDDAFSKYEMTLKGKNSAIRVISTVHGDNPDLFDLDKTRGFSYKFLALFSKYKKRTLYDQKQLYKSCLALTEMIEQDSWVNLNYDISTSESMIEGIRSLLEAKRKYFDHEDDLFNAEFRWFQFYNSLSEKHRELIDSLKSKTDWRRALNIFYLNSLLVKSADSDLPRHDDNHRALKKSLSKIGKEQIKYINDFWYSQQMEKADEFDRKNSNVSIENLYNKRSSHKFRRLSLRQIVNYNTDLFTTFFPVILTSPDVCSNLFKDKNKYFDIVLFDEASQLKLEDNLPALLKGKQVIIAGDEHQMPPSNYFSQIYDGTIDDEDDVDDEKKVEDNIAKGLLSCESLLDFAGELNFDKRHLDFHYRSRHPYLIDFSNHAFYNGRLKPLPNSFDYVPIKYIPVNGTFSDHTNEQEADAVLSIIENNIHKLPNGKYPSVGIATFNISQRNLILDKIRQRQKLEQHADFNQKILELEDGGLFVKNLENIQGDERDVIIMSTTYGTGKDGRFAQRFGPLNHSKGYKLLNVIITRAKYKVYVCSSIPEQKFLNFKEELAAEGANNRRAVFYAYLAYAKAVSENNVELKSAVINALKENLSNKDGHGYLHEELESPFEEEVYEILTEHFDRDKLIPQLKFAGFRIDIVYDPKVEGLPKIAIECDGAAYHSSQEAYLNDIHRQKILENHGFVFHRIWSTNWWRNHRREANRLVEFIKKVETNSEKITTHNHNFSDALTDDFSSIKAAPVSSTSASEQKDKETIQALKQEKIVEANIVEQIVKPTSKVKVRYLNNGKDLTVKLAHSVSKSLEKSNGVQKINNQSALGQSIIGKAIGDTVQVGSLEYYVKVLEIDGKT